MLRTAHFQRPMARLALIAVLLVALAPAMSRWVASGPTQLLSGLVELCTSDGLKFVEVTDRGGDVAKSPAQGHLGMDADCAYCPLLAGLTVLLLTLAVFFPRAVAARALTYAATCTRHPSLFPGLGSRGPPLFS